MTKTEVDQTVADYVYDFCSQKKYGEIVLKIEAGKIVRVIASESIKV